jgi:hypothetical protein
MTIEQLGELGEALLVVSARSSCLKERKDLRALMDENMSTDEVRITNYQQRLTILTCGYRIPRHPLPLLLRGSEAC